MTAPKSWIEKAGAIRSGDLFRWCRWLHGYLSAFAFLSLMFFSATGILLNHPEWMRAARPAETKAQTTLDAKTLAAARAVEEPGPILAKAIAAATPLLGELKSAEVAGEEVFLRLEGPKGSSDAIVDMTTGVTEVTVERASTLTLLNELHKGRGSGAPWKAFIDISGVIFLLLSLIGYVIFFSLRLRWRSSLVVTGVSLLAMGAVIIWLVA